MASALDLINSPAAQRLGLTVDPLEGKFQESQAPETPPLSAMAMQPQESSAAMAPPQIAAMAPSAPAPQAQASQPDLSPQQRRIAAAQQVMKEMGITDVPDEYADLLGRRALQMRQVKELKEAKGYVAPAYTALYSIRNQLSRTHENFDSVTGMMRDYEQAARQAAQQSGKPLDDEQLKDHLSADPHFMRLASAAKQLKNRRDAIAGRIADLKGTMKKYNVPEPQNMSGDDLLMLIQGIKTGKVDPRNLHSFDAPPAYLQHGVEDPQATAFAPFMQHDDQDDNDAIMASLR